MTGRRPPCSIDMRALLVLLVLAASAPAMADEVRTVERSYRKKLIAIDLLAYPLALVTGGASYFLAAPITHAMHDNHSAAVTSLALRTVPVLVGVGVYYALRPDACDHDPHDCPLLAAGGAAMITAVAASVVDWALLPVKTEYTAMPTVAIVDGGGIAGLAGTW